MADSDAALVSRCRDNDREAFNEIVCRYMDRVVTYVRRMVENREDAEDIAQETFVRIHAGLRSFQSRSSLNTWVYRIATNLCIDYRRKRLRPDRRAVCMADAGSGSAGLENVRAAAATEPETTAMRKELSRALEQAIEGLPERLRTVVVLHDVNGLAYDEIAAIVGCPLGTVKSRLFHARSALRETLGPYLRGDEVGAKGQGSA